MTTTIAALQLVRMSAGWQYMTDETRGIIDSAIKEWTDQESKASATRLKKLVERLETDPPQEVPLSVLDLMREAAKVILSMQVHSHDLRSQRDSAQKLLEQDLPADVCPPSYLDVVRSFAAQVIDGRTLLEIHDHKMTEAKELRDEIVLWLNDEDPGEDGIAGEVADNIACDLDILTQAYPEMTSEEFMEILVRKCQKWVTKYGGVRPSQELQ